MTDGHTRAALSVVRALGSLGERVHVVAERPRSLAGASRYAIAEHVAPSPRSDPEGWVRSVEAVLEGLGNALLIPVTEVAGHTVLAHALEQRRAVAIAPAEAYRLASDKHALLERARQLDLEVPHTTLVERPAELAELPPGHRYPVIVKARRSWWLEDGAWREGSVRRANDVAELRRVARDAGFAGGALIQEFVPGAGEGLFFLVEGGAVRVRFAHRRLREKPPSGGVSVLSEAIAPDPQLLAASEALLGSLGWDGVAMVEFRRSPGGRAWLMEVNPRFWGSLQLASDAGVNFPALLVALERGESPIAPEPRLGVRTRWLLGDLDHLWIALRRREMRRAVGRSALGVVGAFLASFFDGSHLEVLRRDDPRPFLRELREWLA